MRSSVIMAPGKSSREVKMWFTQASGIGCRVVPLDCPGHERGLVMTGDGCGSGAGGVAGQEGGDGRVGVGELGEDGGA